MSKPFVSVVMPTYNHAQYIKQAIDSVLGQTYEHLELIIIDNFSTDKTEHIVRSCNDARITYQQFANEGIIAASRNQGIGVAKGDYVAFIDSDDVWFADKLEKQMNLAIEYPDLGMLYSKFSILSDDEENERIVGPKHNVYQGHIYALLLKSNFITSSSTVVRKDILDKLNGFDEASELRCSEDFDLWLRIAKDYPAGFVPEVLGQYRKHADNQSATDDRLQKALNVIDKHCREQWLSPKDAERAKANFRVKVAWSILDKAPQRARENLKVCMRLSSSGVKIWCASIIMYVISFMPFLYRLLTAKSLDHKLAGVFKNAQDL